MKMMWLAGLACLAAAAPGGGARAQDSGQVCLVEGGRLYERVRQRPDYDVDRATRLLREEEVGALGHCQAGDVLQYEGTRAPASVTARLCQIDLPVQILRYREDQAGVVCTYRGSARPVRLPG